MELTAIEFQRSYDYTMGSRDDSEATLLGKLDELLDACRSFKVYKECDGHLMHPRPGQKTAVRIDRLLRPTQALINDGWPFGVIGIEAKGGRIAVGKPLAQMADYGRSAFVIDGGITVQLGYVLLWPWFGNGGPSWSQCIQQRLGAARPIEQNRWARDEFGMQIEPTYSDWVGVDFVSGLTFAQLRPGGVTISNQRRVLVQGTKTGSR